MVAIKLFLMTVSIVTVVMVIAGTVLYRLNQNVDSTERR